ncbi:zf-CSL-domain-containing protein [Aspergillus granulosus]|uniref:Diphthamide biosynthesis protein 3 n=1 Tax=Aspergillus granulosus TaxID=176169 RepID=A0ABR4I2N9_9EURO
MIPPCDPTVLANNPQFQRLYQHLTTALLNPDGSTRATDTQPARKEVIDELRSCQLRNAKNQIKKQTLQQLAFDPDNDLPDDCREPLAIVSLYLESLPSNLDLLNDELDDASVHSLLAPDIDKFYTSLPMLMPAFARALSSDVQDLRALADASGGTQRPNVRVKTARQSPLSPQMSERVQTLRQLQLSKLPAARTQMAATAAEVLAMRAAVLERTVTLLERTKHGSLARATKAKAEHLHTVAHGVDGKLKVMRLDLLATIHTPEVSAALSQYHQHLRDMRVKLGERRELALDELKAYEDADSAASRGLAKSGPIAEIARQYGSLIREIEGSLFFSHSHTHDNMADEALSIYDEIEIEDMTFDPNLQIYHYPCPCGDRFEIAIDDLRDGEEIAVCPSCSLMIRVIFDMADLPKDTSQQAATVSVSA